jgi:hypothetical protein
MINASQIKPQMPVVASDGTQFAIVDHLEGKETIKLSKDSQGQHHYIPMSWVKTVDDRIHVDRSKDRAMKEWSMQPPTASK